MSKKMLKFSLDCWESMEQVNGVLCSTVENLDGVRVEFDGGRLTITVNGKTLYYTYSAGNSFLVDLEMVEN